MATLMEKDVLMEACVEAIAHLSRKDATINVKCAIEQLAQMRVSLLFQDEDIIDLEYMKKSIMKLRKSS